MKEIYVGKSYFAIVDNEDFEELNQYTWFTMRSRKNIYALRRNLVSEIGKPKRGRTFMHHQVLNYPMAKQIDHINGNTLDNRKSNLRLATHSQNQANRHGHGAVYKGVGGHGDTKRKKKWQARVGFNYLYIMLGRFYSPEQAAQTYDIAALTLFGEFAKTNFRREDYNLAMCWVIDQIAKGNVDFSLILNKTK